MKALLPLVFFAAWAVSAQPPEDEAMPEADEPAADSAPALSTPPVTAAQDSLQTPDSTANTAPADSVRPAPKRKAARRDRRATVDNDVDSLIAYQGDVNQLKSPKKAFFMSFVIPGLGQYYAHGGLIRVGIPVAVELSSYIAVYVIRSNYKDLVRTYERYADAHFSSEKLLSWQNYILTNSDSTVLWQLQDTNGVFTHREEFDKDYVKKTSDFYEMIGKYDEFTQGWDDPDPDMVSNDFTYIKTQDIAGTSEDYRYRGLAIKEIHPNPSGGDPLDTVFLRYHDPGTNKRPFYYGYSQHQLDYVKLRDDANSTGDLVLWAFSAMLINRMVSAVDAALAATAYNRRITGGTLSSLERLRIESNRSPRFPYLSNGISAVYRF